MTETILSRIYSCFRHTVAIQRLRALVRRAMAVLQVRQHLLGLYWRLSRHVNLADELLSCVLLLVTICLFHSPVWIAKTPNSAAFERLMVAVTVVDKLSTCHCMPSEKCLRASSGGTAPSSLLVDAPWACPRCLDRHTLLTYCKHETHRVAERKYSASLRFP